MQFFTNFFGDLPSYSIKCLATAILIVFKSDSLMEFRSSNLFDKCFSANYKIKSTVHLCMRNIIDILY